MNALNNVSGAAERRFSVKLLIYLVAFAIPLTIDGYWLLWGSYPDVAAFVLRPFILCACIALLLLCGNWPTSLFERKEARVLGLVAASLVLPSITATDPGNAFTGWAKITFLFVIALLLSRVLRDPTVSRAVACSLMVGSVILLLFILFTYLRLMGASIPTYASARAFKGIAEKTGIPLNAVPFAAVFSYIQAMCLLRSNIIFWSLGAALLVLSSVFTGSRADGAVLTAALFILLLLRAIRSRSFMPRVLAWLVISFTAAVLLVGIYRIPSRTMSKLSEGRWDLWSVAVQKFVERPITGYGCNSWREDLVSRLPGEYSLTLKIAQYIAGGYHNEYLTLLAEEGIIGFAAAAILIWFLVHASYRLGFAKWRTWKNGNWALFAVLFMLLRANVEVPGLFGYGQEPADYLAYLLLAIVVSRFSIEETAISSLPKTEGAGNNSRAPRVSGSAFLEYAC